MSEPRQYLFIYGTLKRGERNHRLLAGEPFVGEAVTEPRYRLYDCGAHPALVEDEANGRALRGEVYLVGPATLRRLDILEDVPHRYELLPVRLHGFDLPVQTYLYRQDVSGLPECAESWSGRK
ncbi:MAG: gamma-glutamylcyclotransferase [Planctomycetes bacterium]|nr:gamma-glutamylcyclotransferase [Planctomycetota bacterium]